MIKDKEQNLDRRFGLTNSFLAPDYMVEVGSFDGESLKQHGTYSPYSKLIGFECNPINYFRSCIGKPVNFLAISDYTGTTEIFMPVLSKNKPRNAIRQYRTSGTRRLMDVTEFQTYTVPCTTLDSFFAIPLSQNKTFSLIIDAEGTTWEILKGAEQFLKNTLSIKLECETEQCWEGQKLYSDVQIMLPKFLLMGSTEGTYSTTAVQHGYYLYRTYEGASFFQAVGAEV
jgi:hypothetical protein